MKKLFISQPMRNKTDEEILKEREKAIQKAKEVCGEEVEVIDSFFQSAPANAKPLWFLGKSLELLSTADIVYFARGWHEARGCKIEHECAIEYGIDTIEDYSEYDDEGMNFGVAIELLKKGVKVAREGWNGKGLFVVYQKAEAWGLKEGDLFKCEPYLQINTVDGSHAMWVPSIRDCLANDWVIVE